MKAVILKERYIQDAKELGVDDVEIPKATDGKLVVKNEYSGINYLDIYQRKGQYKVAMPHILGNEGGGIVHELPPNYKGNLRTGNRVVYIGPGSYAEYTAVDTKHAFKVPEGWNLEKATAYLLQGMTAVYLSKDTVQVKEGTKVVVLAAAGGTGSLLCRQCKKLGAHVIGVVSTLEKLNEAKEYCDQVVMYDQLTTIPTQVDVVYDSVGQATIEQSAKCLKPGGTLVSYGSSSGPFEKVNRNDIVFKQDALFNYIRTEEEFHILAREAFQSMLPQKIHKVYPFEHVSHAHADLESRKTSGKLLLKF